MIKTAVIRKDGGYCGQRKTDIMQQLGISKARKTITCIFANVTNRRVNSVNGRPSQLEIVTYEQTYVLWVNPRITAGFYGRNGTTG